MSVWDLMANNNQSGTRASSPALDNSGGGGFSPDIEAPVTPAPDPGVGQPSNDVVDQSQRSAFLGGGQRSYPAPAPAAAAAMSGSEPPPAAPPMITSLSGVGTPLATANYNNGTTLNVNGGMTDTGGPGAYPTALTASANATPYYYNVMPDQATQDAIARMGGKIVIGQNPALASQGGSGVPAQSLPTNPYGANQQGVQGTGPLGSYGLNPLYFGTSDAANKMASILGGKVVSQNPLQTDTKDSPFSNPSAPYLQMPGQSVAGNVGVINSYLNLVSTGAMSRDAANAQIYRELTGAQGVLSPGQVPDYVKLLTGNAPSASGVNSYSGSFNPGSTNIPIPQGTTPAAQQSNNPTASTAGSVTNNPQGLVNGGATGSPVQSGGTGTPQTPGNLNGASLSDLMNFLNYYSALSSMFGSTLGGYGSGGGALQGVNPYGQLGSTFNPSILAFLSLLGGGGGSSQTLYGRGRNPYPLYPQFA